MKKILLSIIAGLCLLTAAAAEDGNQGSEKPCDDIVIRSLNLSFPFEVRRCKFENDIGSTGCDGLCFGAGLNYNRMTVSGGKDFGFSFMLGGGVAYNRMKIDTLMDDNLGLNGADYNFKVGWGLAPVCNENLILAAHAIICCDYKKFTSVYENMDITMSELTFPMGFDLALAVRKSKNISLFAGLDVTKNLFDTLSDFDVKTKTGGGGSLEYEVSNITATLRIGICWVFNED